MKTDKLHFELINRPCVYVTKNENTQDIEINGVTIPAGCTGVFELTHDDQKINAAFMAFQEVLDMGDENTVDGLNYVLLPPETYKGLLDHEKTISDALRAYVLDKPKAETITLEEFDQKCKEYWIYNNRKCLFEMIRKEYPNGFKIKGEE